MLSHNLKLNGSKTEVIVIGSRQQLERMAKNITICVGNADVPTVEKVSNLGITIDSNLNLKQHITNICKKNHFQLTKIKQHQKYLSKKTTETLVHCFVSTNLDY